jgi:hypothetical protein
MDKVTCTWQQFEDGVKTIVKQMESGQFTPEVILAIPRGGLVLAVKLSNVLGNIPVAFQYDEKNPLFSGKVLIVDDVSDTGKTLRKELEHLGARKAKVATLYYKPHSVLKPDYYAFETDKWIVFPWEKEEPA